MAQLGENEGIQLNSPVTKIGSAHVRQRCRSIIIRSAAQSNCDNPPAKPITPSFSHTITSMPFQSHDAPNSRNLSGLPPSSFKNEVSKAKS